MNPTPTQCESATPPAVDWKARAESAELHDSVKTREINTLVKENRELNAELARLRRQNAAMRDALEWQHHECHTCHPGEQCPDVCVCSCPQCHMEHIKRNALKDDAGSTLLTREHVMPLVEGLLNYEGSMWDCEAANAALSHARTLGLIEKETP